MFGCLNAGEFERKESVKAERERKRKQKAMTRSMDNNVSYLFRISESQGSGNVESVDRFREWRIVIGSWIVG